MRRHVQRNAPFVPGVACQRASLLPELPSPGVIAKRRGRERKVVTLVIRGDKRYHASRYTHLLEEIGIHM